MFKKKIFQVNLLMICSIKIYRSLCHFLRNLFFPENVNWGDNNYNKHKMCMKRQCLSYLYIFDPSRYLYLFYKYYSSKIGYLKTHIVIMMGLLFSN